MAELTRICGRCGAPILHEAPSNEVYGGSTTGCHACREPAHPVSADRWTLYHCECGHTTGLEQSHRMCGRCRTWTNWSTEVVPEARAAEAEEALREIATGKYVVGSYAREIARSALTPKHPRDEE